MLYLMDTDSGGWMFCPRTSKDAEAVEVGADKERDGASSAPKDRGSLSLERDKVAGMDLGL